MTGELGRAHRQRWLLAGGLAAAVVELAAARLSAAPAGITHRRFGLLANLGLLWGGFALAAALLWRVRRTRTVVRVALVVGLLLRLAALSPKAPLSDDLYRYSWDGLVQTHGIDPYRYPPLDPALATLRTSRWLFPPAYSAGTRINRPLARTIYPPVAEAWFAGVHLALPMGWHDVGWELAGLLVELAVLAVLLALLRGERRRYLLLYALCPLPVLEAVQNAHVDGLAVLFVLLTVLSLRGRPGPDRAGAAGPGRGALAALALAAATLVKLYPALLLPLLLRGVGRREAVRRTAVFAGAIGLAYLPHVLAVGPRVLGYLPGYLSEERYGQGSRYLLVGLFGFSGTVATAVALGLLLAVLRVLWRCQPDFATAALGLFTAVLLVATPVQPWYALTVVALATVTGRWAALGVAAGAYPGFFGTILNSHPVGYGRLGYGAAAVGLAVRRALSPGPPALPPDLPRDPPPAVSRHAARRGRTRASRWRTGPAR